VKGGMPMPCLVIVGSGHAGASAALELRRAGFGGRVVMVGEEPHHPYERPPLSKAALMGSTAAAPVLLQPPQAYERDNVEVLTGRRVEWLDPAASMVQLSDGERIAYDAVLLATGGSARPLGVPGGHHAMTLRSHDDALVLQARLRRPGHLTIVGAGVIGLEVAASARTLGWAVSVLEYAGRPMARTMPPEVGAFLTGLHAKAGVALAFDVGVQAIETTAGGRFEVITTSGALQTDLVVAGVGMQPRTELARQAGLEVDGAIVVDEFGRTRVPGVYAAGDATSFWHPRFGRRLRIESWQHAARHASAVARNMLGAARPYDEVPWSWSDQYDVNLQIVGLPLDGESTILRGSVEKRQFALLHLDGSRLVGATLVNLGREMRPCKTLIESGRRLDPVQLADPSAALRALAAA
jgi:NADPH-dependent 2,4-dienoyl-CoA reductase/sulfur reductase-like enzyme